MADQGTPRPTGNRPAEGGIDIQGHPWHIISVCVDPAAVCRGCVFFRPKVKFQAIGSILACFRAARIGQTRKPADSAQGSESLGH